MKTIYLAGGCFWGVQRYFDQFDGVVSTEVGYANGPEKAPTYQEVCRSSGHAETVLVEFDENVISLDKLIYYYFLVIDPTSVNRQGHDTGIQYRTGIYYSDPDMLETINTWTRILQAIVTYRQSSLLLQTNSSREKGEWTTGTAKDFSSYSA